MPVACSSKMAGVVANGDNNGGQTNGDDGEGGGECANEDINVVVAEKKDFEERKYQVDLIEVALRENVILCLPTGSGKTFIALEVTKHYLAKNCGTGKKVIFLAGTVPLVHQQADFFRENLPPGCEVRHLTGSLGVDCYSRDDWTKVRMSADVLVMTTKLLVNALNYGFMKWEHICLLILDECHHANGADNLVQVMESYKKSMKAGVALPRVLGLTATIVQGSAKLVKVDEKITKVEDTLMCRAVTHPNFEEIAKFSTSARVELIQLKESKFSSNDKVCVNIQQIIGYLDGLAAELSRTVDRNVQPQDVGHRSYKLVLQLFNRKPTVLQKTSRILKDLLEIYSELGLYCAKIAAKIKWVSVRKYVREYEEKSHKTAEEERIERFLILAQTGLDIFLQEIGTIMMRCLELNDVPISRAIRNFNSEKIEKTLDLLLSKRPESLGENEEPISCLLFCEKRNTAQILNWFFQDLVEHCPEYNFLKVNFIIGSSGDSLDIEDAQKLAKWQTRVLKDFKEAKLNVVITTSVLEEGIDVKSCNTVIRFDEVKHYPSYIQSMGRARQKNAKFYVLIPEKDFRIQEKRLDEYKTINETLASSLASKLDVVGDDGSVDLSESEVPEFCPGGTKDSPRLPETSVIEAVHRYCSLLRSDGLAMPKPVSWSEEVGGGFKAYLLLPCNTPIREVLEGDVKQTKVLAKRSVFRKACVLLYEAGELNNYLLPRKNKDDVFDNDFLAELAMENSDRKKGNAKLGSKQSTKYYEKMMPLEFLGGPIYALETVCLYKIQLTYKPYNETVAPTSYKYNFGKHPYTFGFLTNCNLSKLPEFTLQVPTGRLYVKIVKHQESFTLSEDQLAAVIRFQEFMVQYVYCTPSMQKLEAKQKPQLFVVPIKKSGHAFKKDTIDWQKMQELEGFKCDSYFGPCTLESNADFQFDETSYNDAVVIPTYRAMNANEPHLYWVNMVSKTVTSHSAFKSKFGSTFLEHYATRWNVQIKHPDLNLLHCQAVGSQRNFLWCQRAADGSGSGSPFDFPPELVKVTPIPASFLLQGQYLLSIIHRTDRLVLSLLIQKRVGNSFLWDVCRNGSDKENLDIPAASAEPGDWDEQVNQQLVENLRKTVDDLTQRDNTDFGVDYINPRLHTGELIEETITKRLKLREQVGTNFRSKANNGKKKFPERGQYRDVTEGLTAPINSFPSFDAPTDFKMVKGPNAFAIMEALTLIDALDYLNLERMEVMGDAVLKLVVSVHIFSHFPKWKEGKMTNLRTRLICNEHLYSVAKKRNLGNMLGSSKFRPGEWSPPGFQLCESVAIEDDGEEESIKLLNEESPPNMREVSDKSIADAAEALIGSYYLEGGLDSALRVMCWIGLQGPDSEGSGSSAYSRRSFAPSKAEFVYSSRKQTPEHLIPFLSDLEKPLAYKFKNKWLVVEALTHPTYMRNQVTPSYQRLEFLGDAVIDFLITDYIIKKTGIKKPGRITDLRSALVNNVTFGCLSDRYDFHRFLLHASEKLYSKILSFSEFQQKQNYQIVDPYMLMTDAETGLPQNVDIPKSLGDIFESIIGAIFVDSGFSLDTTWRVVYRLMKKEIDAFSKNIPINPVRKVMELFPNKVKIMDIPCEDSDDSDLKVVQIIINGPKKIVARGVGTRKKFAKEAAAKYLLRNYTFSKPSED